MIIRVLLPLVMGLLWTAAPLWAQADAAAAPAGGLSAEGRIVQDVKQKYANAEYESCRTLIRRTLEQADAGTLHFPNFYLAEIRVYQALLAYAFREAGYEKEIETFLQYAIESDINFDFTDYALVPTYVLEQFLRIRRTYLRRFSKTTRRHNLGVYGMASSLTTFIQEAQYFNLGLHYGLNLSDNFTLFFDGEFALSQDFFNLMQFRVGTVWFPSTRVEAASLGLGVFYSLKIEDWTAFINVISIEGYGEIILRAGLGVGASVELMRLDILMGSGTFPTSTGYVPLFASDYVRFSFANLRIYLFWNF